MRWGGCDQQSGRSDQHRKPPHRAAGSRPPLRPLSALVHGDHEVGVAMDTRIGRVIMSDSLGWRWRHAGRAGICRQSGEALVFSEGFPSAVGIRDNDLRAGADGSKVLP